MVGTTITQKNLPQWQIFSGRFLETPQALHLVLHSSLISGHICFCVNSTNFTTFGIECMLCEAAEAYFMLKGQLLRVYRSFGFAEDKETKP